VRQCAVAEGDDKHFGPVGQKLNRRLVQVVIMVMRDQHHIHLVDVVRIDRRDATETGGAVKRKSFLKHRVQQYFITVQIHKHAGMPQPGRLQPMLVRSRQLHFQNAFHKTEFTFQGLYISKSKHYK